MKELLILRHAKSSWDNPHLNDHDRPLNQRGKKDAPKMAKWLQNKIKPDSIVTSTAMRAYHTALVFHKTLGSKLFTDERLYHASQNQLLQIIQQFPEENETIMLVGHNPGLNDISNYLFNNFTQNIPTCGLVWIKVECEDWKDLQPEICSLHCFQFPKNL